MCWRSCDAGRWSAYQSKEREGVDNMLRMFNKLMVDAREIFCHLYWKYSIQLNVLFACSTAVRWSVPERMLEARRCQSPVVTLSQLIVDFNEQT